MIIFFSNFDLNSFMSQFPNKSLHLFKKNNHFTVDKSLN